MSNRLAAAAAMVLAAFAFVAHAVDRHVVWHEGREIVVEDRDGWALFEGDILIGRTAEVLARSAREAPDGERIGTPEPKANTLGASSGRWPRGPSGLFEVPYAIETDPDNAVPAAVTLFNQQLAGFMQLVPRGAQADYVAFTLSASDTSGACSSSIGRIGGRQVIQGSRTCGTGVLVHEVGHAIGMFHEQVHGDAATFVQVNTDRVDPARVSNYLPSANRRRATPYDFASLMHYTASNFAAEGQFTMETIPPGISVGQRAGFSAADLEGIRRLYLDPPSQVTVTSFPAGLTLLVDGATIVTPATFNWAIGSTHVIDVPPGAQPLGAATYAFGRWNVDTAGDLAARRTITVAPGDGTITAPAGRPAVSTYVASFVRYKEVRLTTSGSRAGVGGSVIATPSPSSLPGVPGLFYRERQAFMLEGFPDAGARLGGWSGSFSFLVAYTTAYSSPFRGPVAISESVTTPYEYRAFFVDYPFITVRARAQDGDVLGLRATLTRASGTSSSERLPYGTLSWTPGESGTLAMDAVQTPWASTLRYVFRDWDGNPSATITAVAPGTTEAPRTITANVSKEYQAFRQVVPSCAGSITLPGDSSAWYAHGSSIAASVSMAAGWVLAGWEGTASGNSASTSFTVTRHPSVIARLNTVPEALAVSGVSPATLAVGTGATITIDGTGFTPASEVYVAGLRQASQFVSANRLTSTVPAAAFPASGLALVTVTNRPSAASTCSVSATGSIDLVGTAAVTPQTGWWWNSAESGRGFFIEQRGGGLFMAGYFYEADGRATWFTAQGPISGGTFSADMVTFRGGQSLLGAHVAPSAGPTLGRITIAFSAADAATVTWPAGTLQLTRFPVGAGGSSTVENGWWWDPSEPGRGFSIEIQGGAIFIVGFMYDTAGNPVWYFSQGTVDGAGGYSGIWQQAAGGQTLTGAYRAPTILPNAVGSLGLAFTGPRNGSLTLPNGRRLTITRFEF